MAVAVSAAYAAYGLGAAIMTGGAIASVAGAVTGNQTLSKVGGVAMGIGGVMSGYGALGELSAAGGIGMNLATLSAGASLVGGAMQGYGTLTGNSKLATIGGLINMSGALGTAHSGNVASESGKAIADSAGKYDLAGIDKQINLGNSSTTIDGAIRANTSAGSFGNTVAPAASGMDSVLEKIDKYDKLIQMGGGVLKTMNDNKQLNDYMNQQQQMQNQRLASDKALHTAVAIPGDIGVSAPVNTVSVQPIDPNYYNKPLTTGLIARGVTG